MGIESGLRKDSAVNLDHVQTVERAKLERYLGSLDTKKMAEVCRALAVATGCAD